MRTKIITDPGPTVRLSGGWVRRSHEWLGDSLIARPGEPVEPYDPIREQAFSKSPRLWKQLAELNTSDPVAVQTFADKWGPLGILRHHVIQATYRPSRVGAGPDQFAEPLEVDTGEGPLLCVERSDFLANLLTSEARVRSTLRDGAWIGEILWQESLVPRWIERDMGTTYRHYFPTLDPAAPRFPSLHSPAFWRLYGEPLGAIDRAVCDFNQFRHTLEVVLRAAPVRVVDDAYGPAQTDTIRPNPSAFVGMLAHWFEYYLNRVRPSVFSSPASGPLTLGWSFPSLLAAAAHGMVQDFFQGGVKVCPAPGCGKVFTPKRSDHTYCSTNCSSLVRMREIRRVEREKRETQK